MNIFRSICTVAGLSLTLLARPLPAAVFVHSVNLAPQNAGWTNAVNLPQFDPSQGNLYSVSLRISGQLSGTAGIENLEDKFSAIAANMLGDFRVYDANDQLLLNLNLSQGMNWIVDAIDYNLDYDGTGGYTFNGLLTSGQTSASYLQPGDDLTPFIGLGVLNFTVATSDNSSGSSSAGAFAFFSSLLGSGTLEITYTTALIPEPTTLSSFLVALGIFTAIRKRNPPHAR